MRVALYDHAGQALYWLAMSEGPFFSVEQARSLLPTVRNLAARMVHTAERMRIFGPDIQPLARLADRNAGSPRGTEYLMHLLRLHSCVNQIQGLGCVVKGVEEGLVDFPHLMNGREVYLCWKLGEDDIEFWHEVDSGYSGRTPLKDKKNEENDPPD